MNANLQFFGTIALALIAIILQCAARPMPGNLAALILWCVVAVVWSYRWWSLARSVARVERFRRKAHSP